jgi:dolichol-phosphate mannosyltransferase
MGASQPTVSNGQGKTDGREGFRLSLVIPAFNEQDTIRQAIEEAHQALAEVTAEYEIIVVDDGSTDATAELVEAEAGSIPQVRLLRHPRNVGYGAALRTGFGAATLDLVAFTDADCQFDLTDLAYMLPLTRRYDVTCGYRINRQDPVSRRFSSWGYNTLVTALMGSPIHDLDCALKIFHRHQLREILPECNNFFVNTEMVTQARLQGLSIVEVGVKHRPRAAGQSKVSWNDVPRTLARLLPFWWSRLLFPAAGPTATARGRWFWAALAGLALLAGLLLFPHLSYPLFEPDEGRYAEIGREMAESGNWLVPTLNHQVYYDKPPLFYWLVAGSFRLFGTTAAVARLVPAGCALGTVLLTFLFGVRTLGLGAGFLAGLVMTLAAGFVPISRVLTIDGVLSFLVALSLFTGYLALQGRRLHWGWWLGSAVSCALAVLTKGPVAFVLWAPPLAAYAWLNKDKVQPTLRQWLAHAGLVLVLVAPWFVGMIAYDADFAYQFFIYHHVHRFLVGTDHIQPFWYFLPVLFIGCLPWSVLALPLARFLLTRSPAVRPLRYGAMGFCLLAGSWCILFFSLSRGKLPLYILPALPAIALLLGAYLKQVLSPDALGGFFETARTTIPRYAILILCTIWPVVCFCAARAGLIGPAEVLIEATLCVAVFLAVAFWGNRLPAGAAWALSAVLMVVMMGDLSQELAPALAASRTRLACAGEVGALLQDKGTALACYGQEWGSVTFHSRGDLFDLTVPAPQAFADFLRNHRRTVVLFSRHGDVERYRPLVPAGMEMRKIGDMGDATVAVVQAAAK